jgi:hypothetical protein
MKNITLIAIIVLAVSCSKDRRVIKKLDGNWNVDSVHVKYVKKVRFGTTNFFILDTSKSYTFKNCGWFTFDKKHTSDADYRGGLVYIKLPALSNSTDTVINKPFVDAELFDFYVDQVYKQSNYSKLGIVGRVSKIYRTSTFSNNKLKTTSRALNNGASIMLTYNIDSLSNGTICKRKAIFETYISKQ